MYVVNCSLHVWAGRIDYRGETAGFGQVLSDVCVIPMVYHFFEVVSEGIEGFIHCTMNERRLPTGISIHFLLIKNTLICRCMVR